MQKCNNKNINLLIIDDEFVVRDSLTKWFKQEGFNVDSAEDYTQVMKKINEKRWDIILLDIKLPGKSGLEIQKELKKIDNSAEIIMITAYASVDSAVTALKEGAFDYVTKPVDPEHLSHIVNNAIKQKKLNNENLQLRQHISEINSSNMIIGQSKEIKKIIELAKTVARTDTTVMIRGESGTGKEIIAKMIHTYSNRKFSPLITVHCGALPDTLLESELFGHEKGAFTDAKYQRKGKFEMANTGTIFLDEIGTISQKMQIELLRVIESKQFVRVGGNSIINSDFRIICATNRNLEEAVKKGIFREDLYYRLNVFTIYTPALREHISDIPLLVNHFIQKYATLMNKQIKSITPDAMQKLMNYSWPGNIRELENVIERAMVISKTNFIEMEHLPFQIFIDEEDDKNESLESVEKKHILTILKSTNWNISRAAKQLGIDRVTLYNKISKYGFKKL